MLPNEPSIPANAQQLYKEASEELDRALRFVGQSRGPKDFTFTDGPKHLLLAVKSAKKAIELAENENGSPSLFLCRCKILLANVLGLDQKFDEAENYANEARSFCMLLPMNEEVFDVWAKAVIYRSGALVGAGNHHAAIVSLETAKQQIAGFPGMTGKGMGIFDDQIAQLKTKFDYTPEKIQKTSSNGIKNEGECFVATAVYGSPMAYEVGVFRIFRDNILLTNAFGATLVDFYYRLSPPFAYLISKHLLLKTIVRACILQPLLFTIKHILSKK